MNLYDDKDFRLNWIPGFLSAWLVLKRGLLNQDYESYEVVFPKLKILMLVGVDFGCGLTATEDKEVVSWKVMLATRKEAGCMVDEFSIKYCDYIRASDVKALGTVVERVTQPSETSSR